MKPLLIFYINVDNVSSNDISDYIKTVLESLVGLGKEYHTVVMPVRNQPTKVECVNPIIIPTEYYEKYKLNFKTQIICKLKKIGKLKYEQN